MNKIPYGRQFIDSVDIKSVVNSLKEDLITTGNYVKKFENEIVKLLKCKYAVSCSSGTAALHLSLLAINLKEKDIIIMPAVNFIAVYNMSRLIGAKIYLADIDPLTGQMTPKTLLDCIKKNNIKKIKAIITMYLGGFPENVLEFYKIKKKFNCFLIEDACHALGAKYYNQKKKHLYVGSCKHSDISTFSLHPVKTITAGEGGIITTNNKNFFKKILLLRSHGIVKDKFKHWKYHISNIGFNYRLSDINCALALSQLKKINKFISYRKKIFKNYVKYLKGHIRFPIYNKNNMPSYHLFLISINFKKYKLSKDQFIEFFKKKNIFFQYHYIPIYKFTIFNKKNCIYKSSEEYFNNTLSLPIYFNLSLKSQKKIINIINNYLKLRIVNFKV
jgi:dTDP-4-amino-4,6-dideoxygalactose transaminase